MNERRFDAAINPYGCSPAVVAALEAAVRARDYRHYGDPDASRLRGRLAEHLDLPADGFVVYNGSGEAWVWQCLARLMLAQGTFIYPAPSYERFVLVAERCTRKTVAVPLLRTDGSTACDWSLPLDRFIEEVRGQKGVLAMISSPNNPTGNRLLEEASLVALLEGVPDCTVVVDEAYAEYTESTFAPLVRRFSNLVVLKTFSKAYGLAGLRVGYLVANPRLAAEARRFQIPWSVDTLALVAAEAALADQSYLHGIVARIRREVAAFGAALAEIPALRVAPTAANFHFVEVDRAVGAPRVVEGLGRYALRVRRRDDMPDHLRITCMDDDDNAVLLRALREAAV